MSADVVKTGKLKCQQNELVYASIHTVYIIRMLYDIDMN